MILGYAVTWSDNGLDQSSGVFQRAAAAVLYLRALGVSNARLTLVRV